jgi:hypothetical protein
MNLRQSTHEKIPKQKLRSRPGLFKLGVSQLMPMLVETFDFKGKDVKAAFEVGYARFQRITSGSARLLN